MVWFSLLLLISDISDTKLGYQRKAGHKGTNYYPAQELRC